MERYNIVVVDDDALVVEILKKGLELSGFSVSTANNQKELKDILRDRKPDAILLDVNMPEIDGISLCREIRLDPLTNDIPVIMLTAFSDEKTIQDAMLFGASGYITKPFEIADVKVNLESIIQKMKSKKDIKK